MKRKSLINLFSISLLVLIFQIFTIRTACATYLTIIGEGGVSAKINDGKVEITGTYKITNKGDENAKNVFPEFRIGKWAWVGKPRPVLVNSSVSWTVNEKVEESTIRCIDNTSCEKSDLPLRGAYPLLILKHYEDLNGYKFSAADMNKIILGELKSSDLVTVQTPTINTALEIKGNGTSFTGTLTLNSNYLEKKHVYIFIHVPREIKIVSKKMELDIPSGSNVTTKFELENFNGLLGSSYTVYAGAMLKENDVRTFASNFAVVKLAKPSGVNYMLISIIAIVVILFAAFYFIVVKD